METFLSEAVVLEAALVSVLLALWMTWLGLRGLLWLMPATGSSAPSRNAQPVRLAENLRQGYRRRDAA
jgi:hypothetical protein